MKNLKFLFAMLVASFVTTSCTDWIEPSIPYNEFETGIYLRTVSINSGTFNFFNISGSQFSVTMEAVGDSKDIEKIQSVEVRVRHRRGQVLTDEVVIRTLTLADFAPFTETVHKRTTNYLRTTLAVSANETLTATGRTEATINGGDSFDFRLILTTTDGRVFTNTNLSGDVSGGQYFRSPFFYRVSVVCPSDLAGAHAYSTVGWCGNTATGTVTWTADAIPGRYNLSDFSMGAYDACYGVGSTLPGGTLQITDACGRLAPIGLSRWGEVYVFNDVQVTSGGTVLVIDWENDYGEAGVSSLTKAGGGTWPAGLRN